MMNRKMNARRIRIPIRTQCGKPMLDERMIIDYTNILGSRRM